MSNSTRKHMSFTQKLKLAKWLEKNHARLVADGLSQQDAADQASTALRMAVNRHHISRMSRELNLRWPFNRTPNGLGTRVATLEAQLTAIAEALDIELDDLELPNG